jgi:hypothetical protein
VTAISGAPVFISGACSLPRFRTAVEQGGPLDKSDLGHNSVTAARALDNEMMPPRHSFHRASYHHFLTVQRYLVTQIG